MQRLVIAGIILAVSAIFTFVWWKHGIAAADKNNNTATIFIVNQGTGMREIANKLKEQGLINDPVVFFLLVKKMELDNKIQAGDFRLSPSMNAQEIAETLTHGTLDVWTTIPEGRRAKEIADIFKEKISTYKSTWPAELEKHEGYLFPDTYLIPKDATIELIISIMKNNFENKFSSLSNANKSNLTKEDIVIAASMVEREAKFPQDRPLVASVILNRLNIGMKLDIDATIQYALGYQPDEKRWWKQHLTKEDLALHSPYNTYRNPGLPLSPIANPGLAALEAVVNPSKTNYLYYISDTSGRNHYAETIEDHQANIKKYGL